MSFLKRFNVKISCFWSPNIEIREIFILLAEQWQMWQGFLRFSTVTCYEKLNTFFRHLRNAACLCSEQKRSFYQVRNQMQEKALVMDYEKCVLMKPFGFNFFSTSLLVILEGIKQSSHKRFWNYWKLFNTGILLWTIRFILVSCMFGVPAPNLDLVAFKYFHVWNHRKIINVDSFKKMRSYNQMSHKGTKKSIIVSHRFFKLYHLKRWEKSVMVIIDELQLWETNSLKKVSKKSHYLILKN